MKRILVIALVASAVYGGLRVANGEDLDPIYTLSGPVESGAYKPLTVWQTITLGSSYYTNPQRAQNINLAYTYEGPEFAEASKNMKLWDYAKAGTISFGVVDQKNKTIAVMDFATAQHLFNLRGPSDLPAFLAKPEIHVVAMDKTLLGSPAKTTVVKTDKAAPLTTPAK